MNMPSQDKTIEVSAKDCQSRCASVAGCAYFNFWPDGGCHLAGSDAQMRPMPSSDVTITYGPKSCAPQICFTSATGMIYAEPGSSEWTGMNMRGQDSTTEASAVDCQSRCAGV